jgi:hypothetical protein
MALAGTRDTQTNPDAAEMVVRTLENARPSPSPRRATA